MKTIAVIGAGAWGTAIADLLAHAGHNVTLWCYEENVASEIKEKRTNKTYLPTLKQLHARVQITQSLSPLIEHHTIFFCALPVAYIRQTIAPFAHNMKAGQQWILLSKGIEQETFYTSTQIINHLAQKEIITSALSGPSFAHELIAKQPTGVSYATSNAQYKAFIPHLFTSIPYFSLFYSPDLRAIEWCGALKNIITLAIGILHGAGYQDNTCALFFTYAMEQTRLLLRTLAIDPHVLYHPCGIGDMLLTAFGTGSKNRALGQALGKGKTLDLLLKTAIKKPESINTLTTLLQLMKKKSISLPLWNRLYRVVFEKENTDSLISPLFEKSREKALF